MGRIPVKPLDEMPEKTRSMITGGKSELSALNINKMMAHAENSVRHFMRLGNSLLTQSELNPCLRELSILRIAFLCRSKYEWYQHETLGRQEGLPEEKISAVQENINHPVFSEIEQKVLKYTDEVTLEVKSKEATFSELLNFFNHREIVELTLTIGFYNLVARFLENTEVEIENE